MREEILRLTHFSCQANQIYYFKNLSFSLQAGEIHGLIGLSKEQREILVSYFSGQRISCSGSLFLYGRPSQPNREQIYCVRQESSLVSRMSVMENLLVLTSTRQGETLINYQKLQSRCQMLIDRHGLQINSGTEAGALSSFGKIAIELLKAVTCGARIILYNQGLDELTSQEFAHLKRLLLSLTEEGISIVLLCGQIPRMLEASHCVTVVKDGCLIKSFHSSDASVQTIHQVALGLTSSSPYPPEAQVLSIPLLSLKGIRLQESDPPSDLTVQQSEIVCIMDYTSSRAGNILKALYGIIPFSCYHFAVNGVILPTHNVRKSFDHGLLLVEHIEGTNMLLSNSFVRNSITLPMLRRSAHFGGFIRHQFLLTELQDAAKKVGLSPEQLDHPLTPELILQTHLAQILVSHCSVLLLENPFSGLNPSDSDILRHFLIDFAQEGNCVLFSSTHFSEVLEFCTRYYHFSDGILTEQQIASYRGEHHDKN